MQAAKLGINVKLISETWAYYPGGVIALLARTSILPSYASRRPPQGQDHFEIRQGRANFDEAIRSQLSTYEEKAILYRSDGKSVIPLIKFDDELTRMLNIQHGVSG